MPMLNGRAVKKTVARDLEIRTVFTQAKHVFDDARYVRRAAADRMDGKPRHALDGVGRVKWGGQINKRWDGAAASALPQLGPGAEVSVAKAPGKPIAAGAPPCSAEARAVAWDDVPPPLLPGYADGDLPEVRCERKQEQVAALAFHIEVALAAWRAASPVTLPPLATIVDFGAGSGHLGCCLAHLFPDATVILVEPRPFSVETIERRRAALAALGGDPAKLECFAGGIDEFARTKRHFDVGVGLHCCGSLTDAVQQLCLDRRAAFVICPCCYGQAARARGDDGARSRRFGAVLTPDQMRCVASAADFAVNAHMSERTLTTRSFTIAKRAAYLCDSDRSDYAAQRAYGGYVASLRPLLCSPKSNVIAGWPVGDEPRIEGGETALVAVSGDDMVAKLASYASGRWGNWGAGGGGAASASAAAPMPPPPGAETVERV